MEPSTVEGAVQNVSMVGMAGVVTNGNDFAVINNDACMQLSTVDQSVDVTIEGGGIAIPVHNGLSRYLPSIAEEDDLQDMFTGKTDGIGDSALANNGSSPVTETN